MTESQKKKCHAIIHGHAVAAAAGNVVPVPGLGVAADIGTMTTMAMALAGVFGGNITTAVAKNMAIAALKRATVKTVTKELIKPIPIVGQIISSTLSVAMLESAGWSMAHDLDRQCSG